MKASAVIVPAVCFAIGTACGIFFFGNDDGGSAGSSKGDATKTRRPLGSSLGSGKPSDSSGNGEHAIARSGPRSAKLKQLLEFANGGYSTSDVVELYKLTENLDPEALLQLAAEIEQLPPNDHRAYQLRSTVLGSLARKDPDAAIGFTSSIANRNARQNALSVVINEIARTDLDKALGALDQIKNRGTLNQVVQALASSGAEGAPAALHQYLSEHRNIDLQWGYSQMFSHWAREDLQGALAGLNDLTSSQQRNNALRGIGQSISAENIDAGLDILETLQKSEKNQLLGSMLGNLSATDPSKALALLDSHVTGAQRSSVVSSIATNWMNSDPEAAKVWIESLESGRDRLAALQNTIWKHNGQTEWIAAQLASLPMGQQTQNSISNLAQRWAGTDPAAAAAWTEQLPPGRAQDQARQNVMNQWASSDPIAAGEYLLGSLGDEPLSHGEATSAGKIASLIAKDDPEAAVAWMESLDADQKARSVMVSQMVNQWSHSDPESAATYVRALEGSDREQGISTLVNSWGNHDFAAAETFASEIADPKLRLSAISALISGSAYNNPEKAAAAFARASSGMDEAELKENFSSAVTNIANGWAYSDPVAAANWAVDLPEGSNRPQALQSIVHQWAQFEPNAASEWLTTFEPGSDRDGAVFGLVSQIANTDPESAFAWASSIDDKHKRNSSVTQAIDSWGQADLEAARAAVEASDLSEELRNRLLKSFPKTNPLPTPHPGAEDDPFGY